MGYAGYLRPGHGVQIGFGGSVAGSFVPAYLAPRYGGRVAAGRRGVHHPASGRACDVMSGAILRSACDRSSSSRRCLTCTIAVRAQNTEPRIWQGVYTAAQAERGKASFNSSCLRCHGDRAAGQYCAGTVRRPVLHVVGQRGDRVAVREDSRHDAAELRHQHRRPDQARHRRLHSADQRLSRRPRRAGAERQRSRQRADPQEG